MNKMRALTTAATTFIATRHGRHCRACNFIAIIAASKSGAWLGPKSVVLSRKMLLLE